MIVYINRLVAYAKEYGLDRRTPNRLDMIVDAYHIKNHDMWYDFELVEFEFGDGDFVLSSSLEEGLWSVYRKGDTQYTTYVSLKSACKKIVELTNLKVMI